MGSTIRTLKHAVKRGFASPWGWRLVGPVLREPGVIVLTYHRINGSDRSMAGLPVEMFATQMRWLRDNCDPIRSDELMERARRPSRLKPAVLVTFDDGFRDYHDRAYPVLKELGIPATVFLSTSFLDEGGMLWTDQVQWAALSTRRDRVKLPWDGTAIPLPDAPARARLGEAARGHLKKLPDGERRQALQALLTELGEPPKRERQMLIWDEVRRTMDLTEYGGHTHTHPILSRLDREGAEREIRTCRDRIIAETGHTPRYFAYPNGRPTDYTAETKEILQQLGFVLAFSTTEGIAGAESDWFAVKRLPGESSDVADFAWIAAGLSAS